MQQISVMSFDLDDTLWPVGPVILAAETQMWEWLNAHHPDVMRGRTIDSMRAARAGIASRHPDRSHDMTFLRHRALREMFGEHSQAEQLADAAFEIFYAARNRVSLYADARPALERLRQRYRLFGLSNGNADLKRCGIDDLFEGHVSAIGAGAPKPDRLIFTHLARLAGVTCGEILHVGDDPYLDVDGAARAGLHAIWLNRDERCWPEHLQAPERTIKTLAEIS